MWPPKINNGLSIYTIVSDNNELRRMFVGRWINTFFPSIMNDNKIPSEMHCHHPIFCESLNKTGNYIFRYVISVVKSQGFNLRKNSIASRLS